jgi:hypothetical protein
MLHRWTERGDWPFIVGADSATTSTPTTHSSTLSTRSSNSSTTPKRSLWLASSTIPTGSPRPLVTPSASSTSTPKCGAAWKSTTSPTTNGTLSASGDNATLDERQHPGRLSADCRRSQRRWTPTLLKRCQLDRETDARQILSDSVNPQVRRGNQMPPSQRTATSALVLTVGVRLVRPDGGWRSSPRHVTWSDSYQYGDTFRTVTEPEERSGNGSLLTRL